MRFLRLPASILLFVAIAPAGANNVLHGAGNSAGSGVQCATVGGGCGDHEVYATYATIAGGFDAWIGVGSTAATLSGGWFNQIDDFAEGATLAGGAGNRIHDHAEHASIGGGHGNTIGGAGGTIPGGIDNEVNGYASMAAGKNAVVHTDHTFLWSDGTPLSSSGPHQFVIRATGGVGINASPANDQIELSVVADDNGSNYANVFLRQRNTASGILASAGDAGTSPANNAAFYLDQYNGTLQARILAIDGAKNLTIYGSQAFKPGGGAWATSSDARLKRDVRDLDGALERLLALRGTTFEYIDPQAALGLPGRQHGFVAQEVAEVFPEWVETGPTGYLTVALRGFEALTVEALRELRIEQQLRIEALESANAALERRLAALEGSLRRAVR